MTPPAFLLRRIPPLVGLLCLAAPAFAQTDASTKADAPVSLSEFTVIADQDDGYRATNSTAGTRTNEKLKNIPLNVDVVTSGFLRDTGATDFYSLTAYSAGVASNQNATVTNTSTIRGFPSSYNLRNFFRWYAPSDGFDIDRVEIIKGPAAVLYPQAFPGGAINLVTKLPLSTPYDSLTTSIGSFQSFRTVLDVSDGNQWVNVRLNGYYTSDKGTPNYSFSSENLKGIDPSAILAYKNTRIIFDYEANDNNRGYQGGLTQDANGNIYRKIPLTERLMGPQSHFQNTFGSPTVRLEQTITDNFSATVGYNYQYNRRILYRPVNASFLTVKSDAGGDFITQRWSRLMNDNTFKQLQVATVYKFDIIGTENKLFTGYDWGADTFAAQTYLDTVPGTGAARNLKYYIFQPNLDLSYLPGGVLNLNSQNNTVADTNGVYATLQTVYFQGKLRSLFGARYDEYKSTYLPGSPNFNNPNFASNDISGHRINPMAGVVYAPAESYSLFAVYSESFTPNTNNRDAYFNVLPAQIAKGVESGVKVDALGGRLSGSASFFHTALTNMPVNSNPIPGAPNANPFVAAGQSRAQGGDLSLLYSPVPGWDTTLTYEYDDTLIIKSPDPTLMNTRPINSSFDSMGMFSRYLVQNGFAKGLFFGSGLQYRSPSVWKYVQSSIGNTRMQGSDMVLVNPLLGYQWKTGHRFIRFSINAFNILNRVVILTPAGAPTLAGLRSYQFTLELK